MGKCEVTRSVKQNFASSNNLWRKKYNLKQEAENVIFMLSKMFNLSESQEMAG